ncbi:protein Abitram [Brevipalpus obovatus]|uniref:protein Abitram n=1 Tax=Brevipalpus obovatus TaxID=246614 RepID=UPI003D9E648B
MDETLESVLPPNNDSYPLPCDRIFPPLLSITERYFEPRFFIPQPARKLISSGYLCGDQCMLFHSNRIGIVSIAPAHPLLKPGTVIKEVDFQVNYKLNRLENKVSGKSKRGGQKVAETSPICVVHTGGEQETSYVLLAGMKGTLIEVNEKLSAQPNLLHERPWSEGYVAIILPNSRTFKIEKDNLMTHENYLKKISSKSTDSSD